MKNANELAFHASPLAYGYANHPDMFVFGFIKNMNEYGVTDVVPVVAVEFVPLKLPLWRE